MRLVEVSSSKVSTIHSTVSLLLNLSHIFTESIQSQVDKIRFMVVKNLYKIYLKSKKEDCLLTIPILTRDVGCQNKTVCLAQTRRYLDHFFSYFICSLKEVDFSATPEN